MSKIQEESGRKTDFPSICFQILIIEADHGEWDLEAGTTMVDQEVPVGREDLVDQGVPEATSSLQT